MRDADVDRIDLRADEGHHAGELRFTLAVQVHGEHRADQRLRRIQLRRRPYLGLPPASSNSTLDLATSPLPIADNNTASLRGGARSD